LLKAERVEQEKYKKEQLQLIMELKGKVRVFVRVRPLPPDEAAKKRKVYHFTVDERFSEDASQEDIYKEISPLMQTAHDGSKVNFVFSC
ncbi:kinesin-like protein kin-14n, partial [Quercus suber]